MFEFRKIVCFYRPSSFWLENRSIDCFFLCILGKSQEQLCATHAIDYRLP